MINKILGKKKCACGRFIVIANKNRRDKLVCGTCKAYGLEESTRQYKELTLNNKSSNKSKGGKSR